ncbi:MAG TPA: tetratricopeptide repeat protein [Clostridiales bacterium]|nr:tetratricopeptide repeat protein [Clostridiales bacterium]HQP70780.1 tetratricopeptide repeat protein [Clostridiales bacterium]
MYRFTIIILLILLSIRILPASEIENKEKKTINSAIDMMYSEKFDNALGIFNYIKDTYPDHPIGDFFLGFYYNFLASYYETDRFDSKIVLYYDLAEKKADYHLKHSPKDPWFNFYKGASLVNKGYMIGKDGRKFKGITKTMNGISYIEDCLESDPGNGDAAMLLGSYKYYKSTVLSWIYNKRESGVDLLKKGISGSYFSEYLSRSTLGWIYIDYKKFEEAEKTADQALLKYPDNHLFLFLKARAFFERGKYSEAAEIYLKIEKKLLVIDPKYSEKDLFNTYYFLSRSYHSLNKINEGRKFYDKALICRLTKKEKDILADRINELVRLWASEGR